MKNLAERHTCVKQRPFNMQLLFLAPLVVVLVAAQQDQPKPDYCGNYECPLFTSVSQGQYSIRTYGDTFWLTTTVTSNTMDASRAQKMGMFWKLFPYFNGQNTAGTKVKMAVPSLTKVEKRQSDNRYDITMMFYVSGASPPEPNNPSVSLVSRPAGEVFVMEFPRTSLPSKEMINTKANELMTAIGDVSQFDGNVYYSSAYQFPFTSKMKQYEVWMDKLV